METSSYDEKLERILRTASRVFADQGYHRASIRDIAAATDASLSGLYYYFQSKEELLFLIQRHALDMLLERLHRSLEEVEDAEERFRTLVRNHVGFFVSHTSQMKILSHEGGVLTGEYRVRLAEHKREYLDILQEILDELAPPGDEPDCRVASFALLGMMNWMYHWYRAERDDEEVLAEEMSHLFLNGYRSPRGRRQTQE